jgi:hypothetical protein
VYHLIYGFTFHVKVKMPICAHRCLDGFSVFHAKFFKYVLNVLCLTNECAILELLDLKS